MGAQACSCQDKEKHGGLDREEEPTKDLTDSVIPVKISQRSSATPKGGDGDVDREATEEEGRMSMMQVFDLKFVSESSGADPSRPSTRILASAPDWVTDVLRLSNLFSTGEFDEASTAPTISDLRDQANKDQQEITNDSVSVLDDTTVQDDDGTATMSLGIQKSALVRDKLPSIALENHDDINNVYSFAKEVLSTGGDTGISKKAIVKVTGAVRAVKFVPKSLAEARLESILKSVDVCSKFDHPNLASLHEVFEDKDYMYLVLSFCPGGTLQMRLKQGTLTEVKAVIVMQQVLRAVFYLHSNKVVHRDLRPANILFNSSADNINSSCLIKISCFGTACRKERGRKLERNVGTPGYMAPEMSADGYGYGVDMWSSGIVIFEMLCGRLPFPRDSEGDHSMQVTFLTQDQNVSNSARDLICLLLEADAKGRYNIKQALSHKWLEKGVSKLAAVPFDAFTLTQLKSFRSLTPFHRTALRIVAGRLNDSETASCRKLFLYIDRDGDGNLVPNELETVIAENPGIKRQFPDVSEFFKHTDQATGACSQLAFTYTEFVAATFDRKQCLTEAACRAAFRCFDKNRDNYITLDELEENSTFGEFRAEALEKVLQDMDKNKDGKIDFKEFMTAVKKS